MDNGARIGNDGGVVDLYSDETRKRSHSGWGESRSSDHQQRDIDRYRSKRKAWTKPTVELEINGLLGAYGDYITGFCHGFYGSITLSLSGMGIDRTNPDYLPVFDKHCCNGRKKHVIKGSVIAF